MIGNTVATIVLNILNNQANTMHPSLTNSSDPFPTTGGFLDENATTTPLYLDSNGTSSSSIEDEFMFCGANDCQNEEVVSDSIDNYVPPNPITKYVLTGSLLALVLVGMIAHLLLIPNMPFYFFNEAASSDGKAMLASLDDNSSKNSVKKVI